MPNRLSHRKSLCPALASRDPITMSASCLRTGSISCATAPAGIRAVAVDDHVNVRLDFAEHRLHYVALALPPLEEHAGARVARLFGGAILGVVVEDVDLGARQRVAKLAHYRAHGQLFVVAGNQNGNAAARSLALQPFFEVLGLDVRHATTDCNAVPGNHGCGKIAGARRGRGSFTWLSFVLNFVR